METGNRISNAFSSQGLLVYRIWRVDSSGRKYLMSNGTGKSAQGRLRNVMRIIIESGLMYSVIALLTFITIIVGSNAVYVTSDMVCVPKKLST